MLRCKQVQNRINDYVDGLLPESEKALFEQHVNGCPACREELKFLESLKYDLSNLEEIPAPVNLHASIMAAVKEQEVAVKTPFYLRYRVFSPVLAALVLAFILRTPALDRLIAIDEPVVDVPRVITRVEPPATDPLQSSVPEEDSSDQSGDKVVKTAWNTPASPRPTQQPASQNNQAGNPNLPQETTPPDGGVVLPDPDQSNNGGEVTPPQPTPIIIEPGDPVPPDDRRGEARQAALQRYAQNADDYDKHVLYVNKSAVTGMMVFKVGNVSFDYFEKTKAGLAEEDYTESFVESKTGQSLGSLYMIVVEED